MRFVVLLATLLAGGAGIQILINLPIDPLIRGLAIAGWTGWLLRGAIQRGSAERRLLRIRLSDDGTAALLGPDGSWALATVAADSTVFARLAWLKIRPDHGPAHTELLYGNSRECDDWRRLQVIWRHRSSGGHSALGSSS